MPQSTGATRPGTPRRQAFQRQLCTQRVQSACFPEPPPKGRRLRCSPCPILAAAPRRHRPRPQRPQRPLTGARPDPATPVPRRSYKKEEDFGCKPTQRLSPCSASRDQLLPGKRAVSVVSRSTPGPGTADAFQGGICTIVLIFF